MKITRNFLTLISVFMLAFASQSCAKNAASQNTQGGNMSTNGNPVAVFETTMGTFKVELFADKTPVTVSNFITLAKKGFYNGLIFHRVIAGFMIQGGDPQGNGMGGPGYTIADEFVPGLRHDSAGVLSMANTGRPHTGGSQFFITLEPTPWLDGHHTVFGRVVEGLDVVQKIGKVQTGANDKPLQNVSYKITIEE